MKSPAKLLACIIAVLGLTANANAATHRLDFSGQSDGNVYSGYFLLDYGLAVDTDDSPNDGRYGNLVVDLFLQVNNLDFSLQNNPDGYTFVFNGSFNTGDYFGFVVDIVNDATGESDFVAIQFQQRAGTLWGDDTLPDSFDLNDFDPLDLDATNGFDTGLLLPLSITGGPFVASQLTSASLYAVPVPAGLVLLFSALVTLTGMSRRPMRKLSAAAH